jgi:hypothetical protein
VGRGEVETDKGECDLASGQQHSIPTGERRDSEKKWHLVVYLQYLPPTLNCLTLQLFYAHSSFVFKVTKRHRNTHKKNAASSFGLPYEAQTVGVIYLFVCLFAHTSGTDTQICAKLGNLIFEIRKKK